MAKPKRKSPAKKAPAKRAATTKVDFVRAHPGMSAPDMIKAAAKQGMKLTEKYIYTTRSDDRKKAAPKASAPKKAVPASDLRSAIRRLVFQHGGPAVRAAVADVEAEFR